MWEFGRRTRVIVSMCATFPNDGGFTSISPRRGASFPAGVSGLPEPCSELMTLALCPHLVILALVHERVRGRLAALHPATSNKHAKPLCTVRNGLETFHATSLRSHSGKDGRKSGKDGRNEGGESQEIEQLWGNKKELGLVWPGRRRLW